MIIYCVVFVGIKELKGIFNFLLLFFRELSSFFSLCFVYYKLTSVTQENVFSPLQPNSLRTKNGFLDFNKAE